MRRRVPLLFLLTAVVVLACAAPAEAAPPRRRGPAPKLDHGFEVGFMIGAFEFDDELSIDDEFGFGGRFGYLFTPHHEFEFLINGVATNDALAPAFDVDVTFIEGAYVFNFTDGRVIPYLTAGWGFARAEDDLLGSETNAVLGLGAGIRFVVGRAAYVRFEFRRDSFEGDGRVFANNEDVDVDSLGFGVGWRFATP